MRRVIDKGSKFKLRCVKTKISELQEEEIEISIQIDQTNVSKDN